MVSHIRQIVADIQILRSLRSPDFAAPFEGLEIIAALLEPYDHKKCYQLSRFT